MASLTSESFKSKDRRNDLPIFIHSELDDYGLTALEFRVYARLARRAGQHGKHSESIPNMATEFDYSVRSVQRAVKLLLLCKLITRHSRPGRTDQYSLNPRSAWLSREKSIEIRNQIFGRSGDTREGGSGDIRDSGDMREGGSGDTREGGVVTPGIDEGTPSEGTPNNTSPPKPKRSKPKDDLFESLASLCGIDWKVCTEAQRGALNQTCGVLRKAGHTAEQVGQVGQWWWKQDWRGKRGQAPTPAQVREVWRQALAPIAAVDEHPNAYRRGKMVY